MKKPTKANWITSRPSHKKWTVVMVCVTCSMYCLEFRSSCWFSTFSFEHLNRTLSTIINIIALIGLFRFIVRNPVDNYSSLWSAREREQRTFLLISFCADWSIPHGSSRNNPAKVMCRISNSSPISLKSNRTQWFEENEIGHRYLSIAAVLLKQTRDIWNSNQL